MKKIEKIKKKYNDFMFDHYRTKVFSEYAFLLIMSIISASIYAFGFETFITPHAQNAQSLVTGGVMGISQIIALIIEKCGFTGNLSAFISIGYFVLNVPLLIFAFLKIGKRFSVFTLINVGLSSLLIYLFSGPWIDFTRAIGELAQQNELSRVIFAGVCTGMSSGIIFAINACSGGIDVLSYYFAMRKSTSIGKYSVALNGVIMVVYTSINIGNNSSEWASYVVAMFYSIAYLFFGAMMIDLINVRNKKVQLEIFTENKEMSGILLSYFPHGATETKGIGTFTKHEKNIIWMVISSNEVSTVVSVIKRVDKNAFITVTSLNQVYGNFFIKPAE